MGKRKEQEVNPNPNGPSGDHSKYGQVGYAGMHRCCQTFLLHDKWPMHWHDQPARLKIASRSFWTRWCKKRESFGHWQGIWKGISLMMIKRRSSWVESCCFCISFWQPSISFQGIFAAQPVKYISNHPDSGASPSWRRRLSRLTLSLTAAKMYGPKVRLMGTSPTRYLLQLSMRWNRDL